MERAVSFINKGYITEYQITMNNYSIALEKGTQTKSILKSVFLREIYEVPTDNVGYTKYTMLDTEYMGIGEESFKKWTFAKNMDFYSCLYCLRDKAMKEAYYREAEEKLPIPSLTQSFERFPKLPSVYLLVMQAIDVITFDAFLCMANSELSTEICTVKYIKIEEMAQRNIPIGTGIYSNSSYYLNDELYIRMIGDTEYGGDECWIFEYSSNPADIYVENKKFNTALKSKSLYSGKMFVSKIDGDILYGELDEDVVAMGKSKKFTKRVVILEKKGKGEKSK